MSYPGFIIPNTTIAVDFWSKKDSQLITHYFLTHAHTDHTKGLSSTWNNGKIYCSKITKDLIRHQFDLSNDFIQELEIGSNHILNLNDDIYFNVELIDANHCPGSVMFLFEGYFGRILATGDFRFDENFTHKFTEPIDQCYLDTTYLKKSLQAKIPTRNEAFNQILSKIDEYFKKKFNVALVLKKLGKEDLVIRLAKHFRCKILIRSPKRWYPFVNIFDCDENILLKEPVDDDLHIEIVDKFELCYNCDYEFIEPTALHILQPHMRNPHLFTVPYTDHSSYEELIEFIKVIQPIKIIPIVDIDKNELDVFEDYLRKDNLKDYSKEYRLLLKNLSQTCEEQTKAQIVTKVQKKKEFIKEIQYEDSTSPIKKRQKINDNIENTLEQMVYDYIDNKSNDEQLTTKDKYLKICKDNLDFIVQDLKSNKYDFNIDDDTCITKFLYFA